MRSQVIITKKDRVLVTGLFWSFPSVKYG